MRYDRGGRYVFNVVILSGVNSYNPEHQGEY